jgi:penicillin-insensitive murein endopeptidase
MPLLFGERRIGGWWALGVAAPLTLVSFVALARTPGPEVRPVLAVAHSRVVAQGAPSVRVAGGRLDIEPVTIRPGPHPLDHLSFVELATLARSSPEKLGPTIVGRSNRGSLLNPVTLESGAGIEVMNPERRYATAVTVEALRAAVAEVEREFPGSVLRVGDISSRRGGYIRPHRSHQAGVDVDVGFYYRTPARWYTKANAENLDRPRTWAFLKALVAGGSVEYVFVDRSVQALLREHALASGESPEFVEGLFESPAKKDTVVRHTWGHLTHFHVRFMDPIAEETGRRVAPSLGKATWSKAPVRRVRKK